MQLKSRDVIDIIMCAKLSEYILPRWKYLIRQRKYCSKYIVIEYKYSCINVAPRIIYYTYQIFSTYYIHELIGESSLIYELCDTEFTGKIRSKYIFKRTYGCKFYVWCVFTCFRRVYMAYTCTPRRKDSCYSIAGKTYLKIITLKKCLSSLI